MEINKFNPIILFYLCMNKKVMTGESIDNYISKSWNINPHKTLAIIFNNRDKYYGNGNKDMSYNAIIWLRKNHNIIYRLNLENYILNYGCWNDIFKIIDNNDDNSYEINFVANQLNKDKLNLENDIPISLCAKWCPNQNKKNAFKIAKCLFVDTNDNNLMELYRKNYLSPLRKKLNLLETKICNKEWDKIEYENISTSALNKFKNIFIRHDKNRYNNYIKSNNKTNAISNANSNLNPDDLVKYYLNNNKMNENIENQWKTTVIKTKYNNTLNNMVPVVNFTVLNPIIIALALLISNCSNEIFRNKIILFSKNPNFLELNEKLSLFDQVNYIKTLKSDNIINFNKMYDLILDETIRNESKENIPTNIICLSNNDIKEASFTIDYIHNIINNNNIKFNMNDYKMPKLIYWNLSNKLNFPIIDNYYNASLLSGTYKNIINVFIKYQDISADKYLDQILEPYYINIKL